VAGLVGDGQNCDVPAAGLLLSSNTACALRPDHSLWCWGYNGYSQLGDGTNLSRFAPVQVGAQDWSQVSLGSSHVCGVKLDGTLWCWGSNGSGELGMGDVTSRSRPTQVGTGTSWAEVAAGANHTCAIQTSGALWCWGSNGSGEAGLGLTPSGDSSLRLPYRVGTATDWGHIYAAQSFTLALKTNGSLWSWGVNSYGQLGDGSTSSRNAPAQVGSSTQWMSLATGATATDVCGLQTDHTLWCWGNNGQSQLGDGASTNRSSPHQVDASQWSTVGVASDHTCATHPDGTGWCWGYNGYGQLGNGNTTAQPSPVQANAPESDFAALVAGDNFTCALKLDGEVACFGYGGYGQLGTGNQDTNHSAPVQVAGSPCSAGSSTCVANATCVGDANHNFACLCNPGYAGDGTQQCTNQNECAQPTSPCDPHATCTDSPGSFSCGCQAGFVGDGQNCDLPTQSISANSLALCDVRQDGTLWCWGYNGYGQLGDGSTTSRYYPNQVGHDVDWAQVSMGGTFACATKTDGTLWCWGYNGYGQLGLGDTQSTHPRPTRVGALSTWAQVSAGATHACAVQGDGSLWCWGSNGNGEGGDATGGSRLLPYRVGTGLSWSRATANTNSTCATKTDGTLWCWGYNSYGQLGLGDTVSHPVPTQVGSGTDWSHVAGSSSGQTVCGLRGTALYCWGLNNYGQLGSSDTTNRSNPFHVGTAAWLDVSTSSSTTCAVKSDHTLWCWGYNGYGQLGDGSTISQTAPIQSSASADWVQSAASDNFTCGVHTSGVVTCFGQNSYGALGTGASDPGHLVPKQVQATDCSTHSDPCLPNAACTTSVDNSTGQPVLTSVCACDPGYTGDGTGNCDPINECTRTGAGAATCSHHATCTDTTPGYTCACNPGFVGNGFVCDPVVTQLETGYLSTCEVRADGTLWCWGYNAYGQLGDGSTTTRYYPEKVGHDTTWAQVAHGGNHVCAVKVDGSLWCWGYNGYGQLGDGTTTAQVLPERIGAQFTWAQVGAGANHTCAVQTNGSLWCWGDNGSSEGGDPASGVRLLPRHVGAATNWAQVQAGQNFTCGLQTNGTLWCWGTNSYGQLGDGTTTTRTTPFQIGSGTTWSELALAHDTVSVCGLRGTALYCWGLNNYGQLGDGSTINRSSPHLMAGGLAWKHVSVTSDHTCATQADGSLWCWGSNSSGQLGDGSTTSATAPVRAMPFSTGWDVPAVSGSYSCAISQAGAVSCWGQSSYGAMGTGTSDQSHPLAEQVQATDCSMQDDNCLPNAACQAVVDTSTNTLTFACACDLGYSGDGQGACDNLNECTRTGAGAATCSVNALCGDTAPGYTCTCANGFAGDGRSCTTTHTQLSAGSSQTCLVHADGTLWCMGYGYDGTQSTVSYAYVERQVGTDTDWSRVAAGANHVCATKAGGTLWCWGYNDYGQLGQNDTTVRTTPTQVTAATDWSQVSAGYLQTCAIKTGGTLWCWGYNGNGEIKGVAGGSQLVPLQVDGNSDWQGVAAQQSATCGIRGSAGAGALYCWGSNSQGQQGGGNTSAHAGINQVGAATDWTFLAPNSNSTTLCGIRGGSVYCWGSNSYGQVGNNTAATPVTSPTRATAIGDVYASVGTGNYSSCAVRSDHVAFCWGYNGNGQLGDGSTTDSLVPIQVNPPEADFVSVASNGTANCGLKADGAVWCWGYGSQGQLGTTNQDTNHVLPRPVAEP
jgi:alpha-tubulin suppressor-like RCC1 family protein